MTPQFAPVKEGYRIYLASSPQDEPKLQYRRKVQEILQRNNGDIDFLNRCLLEELCKRYGLSDEEAKAIETEEMEPYILFRNKLKRYEEVFSQAVEKYYPFTENTRETLREIQSLLGLRDEDIEPIEKRIIPRMTFESKPPTNFTLPENPNHQNHEKQQTTSKSLESQSTRHLQRMRRLQNLKSNHQNYKRQRTVSKSLDTTGCLFFYLAFLSLWVISIVFAAIWLYSSWFNIYSFLSVFLIFFVMFFWLYLSSNSPNISYFLFVFLCLFLAFCVMYLL